MEKIKNEGCGIVDERIEKLGRYPTQAKTGLEWAPPSAGKWGRPVGTDSPFDRIRQALRKRREGRGTPLCW